MSPAFKNILAIGLIGLVAACAQPAEEEFVVVEPEALSTEPAPSDKY